MWIFLTVKSDFLKFPIAILGSLSKFYSADKYSYNAYIATHVEKLLMVFLCEELSCHTKMFAFLSILKENMKYS